MNFILKDNDGLLVSRIENDRLHMDSPHPTGSRKLSRRCLRQEWKHKNPDHGRDQAHPIF
ncbi:MAG: hypothetical protein VCE91_01600 [Nitrospinota bacterium]